jgi:hypothetical protein
VYAEQGEEQRQRNCDRPADSTDICALHPAGLRPLDAGSQWQQPCLPSTRTPRGHGDGVLGRPGRTWSVLDGL